MLLTAVCPLPPLSLSVHSRKIHLGAVLKDEVGPQAPSPGGGEEYLDAHDTNTGFPVSASATQRNCRCVARGLLDGCRGRGCRGLWRRLQRALSMKTLLGSITETRLQVLWLFRALSCMHLNYQMLELTPSG